MSDNSSLHMVGDNDCVNVDAASEVSEWCAKFGCTQNQLMGAILAVGVNADDVEAFATADE